MGILLSNVGWHFHSIGDPQARAIFMLTRVYLAPRVLHKILYIIFMAKGVDVYEGYGTADCGCIAFEDRQGPGLKVSSRAIVQLGDPITDDLLRQLPPLS